MDTLKGILIILVLLLGSAAFILFVQQAMYKAQVNDAVAANDYTLQFLRAQGVSCSATPHDFAKTESCIEPLLLQKDFKEDGFSQPDEKKQTPGYLIVKNINRRGYDARNFTFLVGRKVTQQGCKELTGALDYNMDCRFDFPERCEKGTVLEVNYTTGTSAAKIFTRNC